MKIILSIVLLSFAVAAKAATGVAMVKGTADGSAIAGTVTFQDTKDGLLMTAKLSGLTPGQHGFHIHEFGSCGDAGKAAGGHYNPKNSPHGFLPKNGIKKAHGGDMGNITAGADGSAEFSITLPKLVVADGNMEVAGRAVVVHEKTDDFSQPAGNSGNRIACGTIAVTAK